MEIKEIEKLYNEVTGKWPAGVDRLPGAGSSRRYYRVSGEGDSLIATFCDDRRDNLAFRKLSAFLRDKNIHVPEIQGHSETDPRLYLQTDHGDVSVMEVISGWQDTKRSFGPDSIQARTACEEMLHLLKLSIDELIKVQLSGADSILSDVLNGQFSRRQILWDLNYFKYSFLKPSGIEFDEDRLEDDFEAMAGALLDIPDELNGFMYRDFQSRNIMVEPFGVTLIDFQGGRRGPVVYDIVSLLWQAKAGFTDEIRGLLKDYYAERYSLAKGKDMSKEIDRILPMFVLFRTLQVLGAYGFRGLIEKKAHFIESIPNALLNLEAIVDRGVADKYPELLKCCRALINQYPRYAGYKSDKLTVEVFSFSYKKGYPADFSGNGGGFMFDCRGMHNPGRYAEYKSLTGLDHEVMDFLEERGEVQGFLEAAWRMVEPTVACYKRRGFKRLQVGFGCTGGRHRSVYCAQHLAERLAKEFPDIRIVLRHREQGIGKVFDDNLYPRARE